MNDDLEPNPHYTILRSLWELYQNNLDDPKALGNIGDIAWALGMDLGYNYAYFELAELTTSYLHDPKSISDDNYYIREIKRQLRIFEEHEQNIVTEHRRQYEADRAAFPEIAVAVTFAARTSSDSSQASEGVIMYLDNSHIAFRGGSHTVRQLIQDTAGSIDHLDFADSRYTLEKIAKQLPLKTGGVELMEWHIVTREDAFPPFKA
jgi:hypothetical protein